MRKFTSIAAISLLVVAVITSLISAILCGTLSKRIERLTRVSRADMVYLRGYIRDLEEALSTSLSDNLAGNSRPTQGEQVTEEETASESTIETEVKTETETETEAETEAETETDTEQLDVPAVNTPDESSPPETESEEFPDGDEEYVEETEPKKVLYTLTVHNGRIGVFDATGRIICILNVFTPSLPAADLAALGEGVPIYSQEELWEILDKYA